MNNTVAADHTGPLVYFNFVYFYGGTAHSTVQLIRALRDLADILVVDAYGGCAEYIAALKKIGIAPIVLCPDWSGKTTIGGSTGIQRLARMISSFPHMMEMTLRLRKVLREIRPRAMWVDQEKALFAAWLAAPPDLPIAYMVRGELRTIRPYCALAWRRVEAVMGVSADSLRHLRATRYAHGNHHVVYDGIDVDHTLDKARPEPRSLPGNDQGALRVVFPAVLASPLKGHEIGIRAVSGFIKSGGQAELWVCGDVPPEVSPAFRDEMRKLASDLEIQNWVHFLGWRDDMLSVMARSDVVLLPSFTEGLPTSLLEAMTLARPVIATRVGGIPELVRDGTDGILVDPGDVEGIAQALQVLCDPHIRERMGSSGQGRVLRDFTTSQLAKRFMSVMNTIVEQRGR